MLEGRVVVRKNLVGTTMIQMNQWFAWWCVISTAKPTICLAFADLTWDSPMACYRS
jgi:hypothetical protein